MLEDADHEGARVARQDVLGAIAVVHIKVHHRHAVQVVALQRVFGSHRHVVEKAKPIALCGWHGGPGGAPRKGVFQLARHHGIGGGQGGARSAQGGLPGVGVDGGVGVELRVVGPPAISSSFSRSDMPAARPRASGRGPVQCRPGRLQGLQNAPAHPHSGDQQTVFNGIQPLRAFRVAGPIRVSNNPCA